MFHSLDLSGKSEPLLTTKIKSRTLEKLAPLSEPYKKQINLGHNIEENSEVSMKL